MPSSRRRLASLTLLLAAAAPLASCGGGADRPRHVLVVSIDTLRADRLGCMGRENAGTPRLDAIGARGAVFTDALAPAPLTLPSHATLLTGLDTARHRIRHNMLYALPPSVTTVAEALSQAGWRTGAFVGSAVLEKRHGLDQGFDVYTSPQAAGEAAMFFISERSAFDVNRDALAWLERGGEEPFFAWVHYMEPHAPYVPPEPERSRHAADPYQGEVAATDRALGELLDGLERLGLLEDTLVIVTSDHGEDLGDHGEGTHGIFVYQSTLHVPFLVAGPGVQPGRVVDEPVGLVDVVPTVLEALEQPALEPTDGTSLWPALSGGAALDPERALYAETFAPRYDYGWSELRALKRGRDKLIQAPRRELYELESDPGERNNLAPSRTAEADALASALGEHVVAALEEGFGAQRVQLSAAEQEALAALGYLSGVHGGGDDEASSGAAVPKAPDLPDPKDVVHLALALDGAGDLIRAGRFEEAEAQLRGILDESPDMLEARLSLLISLLLQLKMDEALVVGENLIARAEQAPNGERIAAKVHVFLGRVHYEAGRFQQAAEQWEQAFVVPQPPVVYELLAEAYLRLEDPDEALGVIEDAAAAGEASPRLEQMRAYIEQQSGGG